MKTEISNVILLDTDAVTNFINGSNAELNNKIQLFKNINNAQILVTYLTWYELFKSATDENLIKEKLKLLTEKTDGYILHDDIDKAIEPYFNPENWLSMDPFPLNDFLLFIKNLKENVVFQKISRHVLDTLYVTVYTILLFDHLNDYHNVNKIELLKKYIPMLSDNRKSINPIILELLSNHSEVKDGYMRILYSVYKGIKNHKNDYTENYDDFIKRIRSVKHTDILNKLRRINKLNKGKVVYDLTSKDTLFEDIYSKFYIDVKEDYYQECKKFLFKNNPLYGGRFHINDYIDMSNFLLSRNTPNAIIHYYTEDKKWKNFIKNMNESFLLILE